MAAQVVFQEQTVKAIADAIRAKIGSSNSIAGKDFAGLIDGIEVGGGISFSMGTYTPTETVSLSLPREIQHNSGFIPDIFWLWSAEYGAKYNLFCIVARFKYLLTDNTVTKFGSYTAGNGTSNVHEGVLPTGAQSTETSVWVRSGTSYHKLGAGQTYKWLAIGGLS